MSKPECYRKHRWLGAGDGNPIEKKAGYLWFPSVSFGQAAEDSQRCANRLAPTFFTFLVGLNEQWASIWGAELEVAAASEEVK